MYRKRAVSPDPEEERDSIPAHLMPQEQKRIDSDEEEKAVSNVMWANEGRTRLEVTRLDAPMGPRGVTHELLYSDEDSDEEAKRMLKQMSKKERKQLYRQLRREKEMEDMEMDLLASVQDQRTRLDKDMSVRRSPSSKRRKHSSDSPERKHDHRSETDSSRRHGRKDHHRDEKRRRRRSKSPDREGRSKKRHL